MGLRGDFFLDVRCRGCLVGNLSSGARAADEPIAGESRPGGWPTSTLNQEDTMTKKVFRKDDLQAHIFKVFLKNISQSLPNFIFWKDKESVYLGCNENFAHLVGLSKPEDIVGKSDRDLNWDQSCWYSSIKFRLWSLFSHRSFICSSVFFVSGKR